MEPRCALGVAMECTTALSRKAAVPLSLSTGFELQQWCATMDSCLTLTILLGIPFNDAYPWIAWSSWGTNVLAAHILLSRGKRTLDVAIATSS